MKKKKGNKKRNEKMNELNISIDSYKCGRKRKKKNLFFSKGFYRLLVPY